MLLRAVVRLAPPDIQVALYPGLGSLPLFNPDIEATDPAPVADLRNRIMAADALVIASPEYAHGVTGVLKNALDWMVGNESLINRPVALLNASARAVHAQAALRETLVTMSARVMDSACVTIPILGSNLTEDEVVHHPEISGKLVTSLRSLQAEVGAGPGVWATNGQPGAGAHGHPASRIAGD